jgi:type IV pilus assembly protein PilC
MPLSHREKQRFFDSLSRLVHAGVTLNAALDKLALTADRALRPVMKNLRRALGDGQTTTEAFRAEQRSLGVMEASVIGAAERTGRLEFVLRQLAEYHEALARARESICSKLAYPIFIFHFGILALSAPLLVKEGVNAYLRATLGVFGGVYLAVFIFVMLAGALAKSAAHGAFADALLGYVPIIGRIRRGFATSRFCLTYELHLAAGVNAMEALLTAGDASQSGIVRRAVRRAVPKVREGLQVGEALAQGGSLPEELVEALIVGEESGQLDQTLPRLAAMFQAEALAALSALAEWLPRCIYLAVVAYMAYAIVTTYTGMLQTYEKLIDTNAP